MLNEKLQEPSGPPGRAGSGPYLSDQDFLIEIKKLYPLVQEVERTCLNLFVKDIGLRGPTGVVGDNELAYSISLMLSSVKFLKTLARKHNMPIPECLDGKTTDGFSSFFANL